MGQAGNAQKQPELRTSPAGLACQTNFLEQKKAVLIINFSYLPLKKIAMSINTLIEPTVNLTTKSG